MSEGADGDLAPVLLELAGRLGASIDAAPRLVARGVTHECYRMATAAGPYLLKVGAAAELPLLEAEAAGLAELEQADAVSVPHRLACFATAASSCLVLEWIDFAAPSPASEAALGRELAAQHRRVQSAYGWRRDNWIGATPQANAPCASWLEFWGERRLRPQLELAFARGLPPPLCRAGDAVLDGLAVLLDDHEPPASLLHGDLWAGNWGADRRGRPYLLDPAVYYGDRETDLAMSRLFGGFGSEFYAAYEDVWPLAAGWPLRAELYNLYHLLNHYNVFGSSYLAALSASLDRLLMRSNAHGSAS
jgi:protein-ribulosamine 3-kinase